MIRVDRCNLRHCLGERNVNGAAVIHTEVKLVGDFLLRTFFCAKPAACAYILFNVTRAALNGNLKITHKAAYLGYLGIGENANFIVLRHVHHFRGQNTGGAVERGESFIKLSHFAAYCRLGFNYINGEARVGNVKRGLNARNTAAYNQGALCNGAFARGERRVKVYLCNRRFGKYNCLFGAYGHFLMYPGALLAYVGNFHHIGVKPRGSRGFAECSLMHTGRAGANHNACKLILGNSFLYNLLTCL